MYVGRTSGVLVYNARQMFQHCLDEQDLILIYCKMISLLKNSEQKFASSLPQGIWKLLLMSAGLKQKASSVDVRHVSKNNCWTDQACLTAVCKWQHCSKFPDKRFAVTNQTAFVRRPILNSRWLRRGRLPLTMWKTHFQEQEFLELHLGLSEPMLVLPLWSFSCGNSRNSFQSDVLLLYYLCAIAMAYKVNYKSLSWLPRLLV